MPGASQSRVTIQLPPPVGEGWGGGNVLSQGDTSFANPPPNPLPKGWGVNGYNQGCESVGGFIRPGRIIKHRARQYKIMRDCLWVN